MIKESCGLTLARKFKLPTLASVFRKFGKDLGTDISEEKRVSIIDISYRGAVNISKAVSSVKDPLKNLETV